MNYYACQSCTMSYTDRSSSNVLYFKTIDVFGVDATPQGQALAALIPRLCYKTVS